MKNKQVHYAAHKHPHLEISENQLKVIKDKYLRHAVSVEAWLDGVAHNISLSEILLHPKAADWGVFAGVRLNIHLASSPAGTAPARLVLFHEGLDEFSQREANFARLIKNLEGV